MTVKNFQGFPMLKEVECSGETLPQEVEQLVTLTLFRFRDNVAFVHLNSMKQECKTFHEYSSCTIVESDSKKSSVRTLLADLKEEETISVGCNVTALRGLGHPPIFITWSIPVHRESKFLILVYHTPCFSRGVLVFFVLYTYTLFLFNYVATKM
jgi:hypothetical protein